MSKQYSDIQDYIQQRGFYEAVVEDGADIIFVVGYDGVILYHNPSVLESLGHPPKSLIGRNFFDYILPEIAEDFKSQFQICISEPYAENIEFTFRKNDKSYSYLEFNSVNLNHKEGINGLILDCRDVNQRKQDAEELLRAQKAKEQFMANMSHEIRTPVNGIAGMITLLSETSLSQEQKKYINAIKTSSDNLKVIINDILDISIIESGKLKFEKIGFNIKHQLRSIIETFIHQANEKSIYLEYEADSNMCPVVLGDPVRLNQILMNLISNGLKFTDKGGIRVNVSSTSQENNESLITFEVIDTGIGIAEGKLDTIFESFSQADESVTRKYGGTGLGLAISRQLVELQDGTISVTSTENFGTTFTFSIPYQLGGDDDLVIDRNAEESQQDYHSLENVSILLVEDNDINRMYAENILKKWNCKIDTAENGYIATEKVKKGSYNLVLMDIQMPVMDGIEATKMIRRNFPDPINKTPIIALTANVLEGDPEKYTKAGMDGHLSKPFLPKSLYDIIVEHTDKSLTKINSSPPPKSNETKIIDLSFITKVSDGNNEFVKDLIGAFIESTPSTIVEMKAFYENKEWSKLGGAAHKIKPSTKLLGVKVMHDLITELEAICENSVNESFALSLITQIDDHYQVASEQLEDELSKMVD